MRISSDFALNASRKACSVPASRRDNAGCPAGVRRGACLNQTNPAPAIAAIDRNAIAAAKRTLRRLTPG